MGRFIIIKTKDQGIFISDNIDGNSYFNSKIPNYFFDGEKLIASYKKDWYKLPHIPSKIEVKGANKYENKRYELKAGFPVSKLTPEIILEKDWDEDSEISGLYAYMYDTIEGELESIDFEIELLSEEENFYIENPKYKATPTLLTSLTVHPTLHSERPCNLTGEQFYGIIRNHVKLNINPRYAKVTSDYDFCFTVKKVIPHEAESYTVDVGKRKPKYETRYRRQREITIFETAPKIYNSYPVQKGIEGKNQKDLENKVEEYLDELMEKINKPLIECKGCKGLGVIIEK